jgi:hypothetical protein
MSTTKESQSDNKSDTVDKKKGAVSATAVSPLIAEFLSLLKSKTGRISTLLEQKKDQVVKDAEQVEYFYRICDRVQTELMKFPNHLIKHSFKIATDNPQIIEYVKTRMKLLLPHYDVTVTFEDGCSHKFDCENYHHKCSNDCYEEGCEYDNCRHCCDAFCTVLSSVFHCEYKSNWISPELTTDQKPEQKPELNLAEQNDASTATEVLSKTTGPTTKK